MVLPTFEFTNRVVPIVQMGRFQRLYRGRDRWGQAGWGVGKWGRAGGTLYEPQWAEVTCDVHEVTTQTGRSSASDRFTPATAQIIASNVSGWGDGEVPTSWPQFLDDFERTGPELDSSWERWSDMEVLRPAMTELLIEQEPTTLARAATVVKQRTGPVKVPANSSSLVLRDTYQGEDSSATLTVGPFPAAVTGDIVWLSLFIEDPAGQGSFEIPGWVAVASDDLVINGRPDAAGWSFFLFRHRVTGEEAATDDVWEVPCFGRWNWTAWVVGGCGESADDIVFGARGSSFSNSGTFTFNAHDPTPTTGCMMVRVMAARPTATTGTLPSPLVNLAETCSSPDWEFRQWLAFDGGTTAPTLYANGVVPVSPAVPWTEASSGTTLTGFAAYSIMLIPGPNYIPDSYPYEGSSGNRWAVPYVGDHFVEAVVSGLPAPERVWPDAGFLIELYVHLEDGGLGSQVASFEWVPDWDDPADTGRLSWSVFRRDSDGTAGTPFDTGFVDFGAEGFPTLTVFRFEAGTDGELRLFFQGSLLVTATDPEVAADPLFPLGQHVAIYSEYHTGSLSYQRTIQPGPTRFETVAGGSHTPNPIYMEPGTLIRIGVHHERYDYRWFFRGYVDALRPIYHPERHDTVRIECIDALGEVGRLRVDESFGAEREATDRVRRILNQAEWPEPLRSLDDDATIMSGGWDENSRTIDLLTQTAESCGGAVYGGPVNGDVVFRRKDWQGWDPDKDEVDGWITNRPEEAVDFTGLVVCPSGWDRSWDRQDMATRVTYQLPAFEDEVTYRDADAERRWGIEEYERTLVTVYQHPAKTLAKRQLRLRGPEKFPRVEAVFLDAATSDEALDMMATATFTKPHHYFCSLKRPDHSHVFGHRMIVTGLRHVIGPNRWTCRIALDLANPFIAVGGRWSNPGYPRGRWGVDVWGHAR